MPTPGCLKLEIELPPDFKTCEDCKQIHKKWFDKPKLFYADGGPVPNCIHYCVKYRKKVPKK